MTIVTTPIDPPVGVVRKKPGAARRLFGAGFPDLISVIPPDGALSERSSVKPSQTGKVPGKKISDGWCGFSGWQEHTATFQDAQQWDEWESNIGLKGDSFPGLDLDIDDEALCTEVLDFALETLGPAPIRLSRGHRRLLVYRTEVPFTRIALKIELEGQWHLVELLGQGRQYLVHGTHPSGEKYRWQEKPLWEWSPEDIPLITREGALLIPV